MSTKKDTRNPLTQQPLFPTSVSVAPYLRLLLAQQHFGGDIARRQFYQSINNYTKNLKFKNLKISRHP
jgi:hypothetical protein